MDKNPLVLGRGTAYYAEYNPKILTPIARAEGRRELAFKDYKGFDLWRFYELTCLDAGGCPRVMWGSMRVPCDSEFIVESKSFKLYLGSFAMTKIKDQAALEALIKHDLDKVLETDTEVKLYSEFDGVFAAEQPAGICIDQSCDSDNTPFAFEHGPELLTYEGLHFTHETLHSNILRTLCPVTGQPDIGTVIISYKGRKISRQSLFRYLVSLRNHRGFHEQCCELIFSDLLKKMKPKSLTVTCSFTRRGGIDITPVRATDLGGAPARTPRQ